MTQDLGMKGYYFLILPRVLPCGPYVIGPYPSFAEARDLRRAKGWSHKAMICRSAFHKGDDILDALRHKQPLERAKE
jgi:hypothetical protein